MPTLRRCSRLLLVPGVLSLALPGGTPARDRPDHEPTEGQLIQRYGKPSERDVLWHATPAERDHDRDGLPNRDDWDDDNDGLADEDEGQG